MQSKEQAAFHAHIRQCQYCREHPCELCGEGQRRLKWALLRLLYNHPAPDDELDTAIVAPQPVSQCR